MVVREILGFGLMLTITSGATVGAKLRCQKLLVGRNGADPSACTEVTSVALSPFGEREMDCPEGTDGGQAYRNLVASNWASVSGLAVPFALAGAYVGFRRREESATRTDAERYL
tara:strand:+ start:168 stop:509 length:342 start_codon:yes stop_codon:yes gene_type:complete